MALRVLSGVIRNQDGPVQGSVVIGFSPHVVLSAPQRVEVEKMRTVGASGRFTDVPAEHVALREIDFRTVLFSSNRIRNFIDTITTLDQITVNWSRGPHIIGIAPEISYLIIGDVGEDSDDDGNDGPSPRPPDVIVDTGLPGVGDRPPVPVPGGTDDERT